MMLRLIKYLHDKIAVAPVGLTAVGIVVLGLLVFEGMVQYNQTANFCQSCHVNRGPYKNIDLESTAHKPYKDGDKTCLDCHTDKNFHVFAKQFAVRTFDAFEKATNPEPVDRFEVMNVPDEKCLDCHFRALDERDADGLELSPRLARIGLRFDHQKHFDLKSFTPKLKSELLVLRGRSNLDEGDRKNLEFLENVRLGACDQCHEKRRPETLDAVDRQINFYATNPVRCSGCHVDAVTGFHPGQALDPPLVLPSEQTCKRCHNGRLHGRIVTFPARCDSQSAPYTEFCTRCHPNIEPGIFKHDKNNATSVALH